MTNPPLPITDIVSSFVKFIFILISVTAATITLDMIYLAATMGNKNDNDNEINDPPVMMRNYDPLMTMFTDPDICGVCKLKKKKKQEWWDAFLWFTISVVFNLGFDLVYFAEKPKPNGDDDEECDEELLYFFMLWVTFVNITLSLVRLLSLYFFPRDCNVQEDDDTAIFERSSFKTTMTVVSTITGIAISLMLNSTLALQYHDDVSCPVLYHQDYGDFCLDGDSGEDICLPPLYYDHDYDEVLKPFKTVLIIIYLPLVFGVHNYLLCYYDAGIYAYIFKSSDAREYYTLEERLRCIAFH